MTDPLLTPTALLTASRDLQQLAGVLRCRPEEVLDRINKLQAQANDPKKGPKARKMLDKARAACPTHQYLPIDEPDGRGFAIVTYD